MSLGIALQNQIAVLQSRAFEPKIVYTDPHSTFRSMTWEFPEIEIDVGEKGDYVAKVDVKIRRIKETVRKVLAGLPWSLPKQLVGDLVAYAVSRLNIRWTTALAENVCPKVLFTEIPVRHYEHHGTAELRMYCPTPSGKFYWVMDPVEDRIEEQGETQ